MNSGAERSATTIQYRLNLPYTLHPVSPALSALHVSRAAALHPEASTILHPSHCPRCGTYRFSGDHPTHLVGPSTRKKRRRAMSLRSKTPQRRCHLCSFSSTYSPSPNSSSALLQLPDIMPKPETAPTTPQTKEIGQGSPPADVLRPVAGTVPTARYSPFAPSPGQQPRPKSRHEEIPTLRGMLSRDRQRDKAAKAHQKRKEGHEGLAAFLKAL